MKTLTAIATVFAATTMLAGCSPDQDETAAPPPAEMSETQPGADEAAEAVETNSTTSPMETAVEEDSDTLLPDSAEDTSTDPLAGEAGETLQPLGSDAASILDGELRCSFAEADGDGVLLVAAADVDEDFRPTAAVDSGNGAQLLYGEKPGGFGTLEKSAGLFAGAGYVIAVELGETDDTDNTEQTITAATMSVNRVDGASRTYDGEWTCGP